jgi:hypothetical protein
VCRREDGQRGRALLARPERGAAHGESGGVAGRRIPAAGVEQQVVAVPGREQGRVLDQRLLPRGVGRQQDDRIAREGEAVASERLCEELAGPTDRVGVRLPEQVRGAVAVDERLRVDGPAEMRLADERRLCGAGVRTVDPRSRRSADALASEGPDDLAIANWVRIASGLSFMIAVAGCIRFSPEAMVGDDLSAPGEASHPRVRLR